MVISATATVSSARDAAGRRSTALPTLPKLALPLPGTGKPSPISLLVRYVRQTSDERSPSKCRAIRGSGARTDSMIVGQESGPAARPFGVARPGAPLIVQLPKFLRQIILKKTEIVRSIRERNEVSGPSAASAWPGASGILMGRVADRWRRTAQAARESVIAGGGRPRLHYGSNIERVVESGASSGNGRSRRCGLGG
jgi:hypothetical protein